MKRESLGWFVAGALAVLACTLGAMQQREGQVARYQLIEGQYDNATEGAISKRVSVFRIDTVTGATDKYMWATTQLGNGKLGHIEGWFHVKEALER